MKSPWTLSFRKGPRGGRRFIRAAVLALAFLVGAFPNAFAGDPPVSKEYRLKAAFLYNFTKFIEWPPARFPSPDAPIVIGIWGNNPFGEELTKVVRGREANGHSIVVRAVRTNDELAQIHLLFVPRGEEASLGRDLDQLHAITVITVGETDTFSAAGGAIVFTHEGDKLRFTIRRTAGEKSGLKFSAQLLKLATELRE